MTRIAIPARERLIFALDVPDADAARRLAGRLGDSVQFYKLGLELFMSGILEAISPGADTVLRPAVNRATADTP